MYTRAHFRLAILENIFTQAIANLIQAPQYYEPATRNGRELDSEKENVPGIW